jgi:hypothetical protein
VENISEGRAERTRKLGKGRVEKRRKYVKEGREEETTLRGE